MRYIMRTFVLKLLPLEVYFPFLGGACDRVDGVNSGNRFKLKRSGVQFSLLVMCRSLRQT